MKKALLITYFFPPVNAVAGFRAWSWAKRFKEHGIHPTVVTRHWSGSESRWSHLTDDSTGEVTYEEFNEYSIYRLPSRKIKAIDRLKDNLLKFPAFSKLFYMVINAMGFFNAEADARASFRNFLRSHLRNNKYDFIITTSPPLNLIRLASELHKEFNIPVHIDFRDLWNNGYLNATYRPPFNLKWIDRFKRWYLRRWMKDAQTVSAVSRPIAGILNYVYSGEVFVITNGFDEIHYADAEKSSSAKFRFSLVGTYYPQQPIGILIDGLNLFLRDKSPDEFVINLIGVSVHDVVLERLATELPNAFLHIEDRVSPEVAAEYVINSEVLFQAAWEGYRGIYTTKLFDFIASGNNIMLAPGDDDVMDELIDRTGTGRIANSTGEFVTILEMWFAEWKKTGKVLYEGNKKEIMKYSRQNVAAYFAKKLLEHY